MAEVWSLLCRCPDSVAFLAVAAYLVAWLYVGGEEVARYWPRSRAPRR